ncbi:hypothetical protein BDR06DRAFT_828252, partial [Suillus hirtellus]
VKEKDLLFLIELVSPYLEDFDRQSTVFALLRAIVVGRLIVPELYDIMAASRICYLGHITSGTDFFFAQNLSYEHASGCSSVLELLGVLVNKFDSALLAKHAEMILVALVLCLANDEDKSCREASTSDLQSLIKRLGEDERKVLVASPHAAALFVDVQEILDDSIQLLTLLDGDGDGDRKDMDVDVEWQPPYQAMLAVSKLLQTLPEHTLDAIKTTQDKLVPYLLFPHAWIR